MLLKLYKQVKILIVTVLITKYCSSIRTSERNAPRLYQQKQVKSLMKEIQLEETLYLLFKSFMMRQMKLGRTAQDVLRIK